jgi:hypothetical protein
VSDEPYQVTERGDPRDRITNQLPLQPVAARDGVMCAICGGVLTQESLHADGTSWACPCGRTRLTVLSE